MCSVITACLRKHLSETLSVHTVNLTAIKTDISTVHKQTQVLSESHVNILTSVSVRLKQRLVEEKALWIENISQLSSQCTQLSEDNKRNKTENKRLVSVIQQMELQCEQLKEANKIAVSELEGKLNGINIRCICACKFIFILTKSI